MRKNLLSKLCLVCAGIFLVLNGRAQSSFQYRSSLSGIESPGFYKIVLAPGIVAKSRNDLNDIRILDEQGKQVPYILRSDKKEYGEKKFIDFPILEIKKEADKQTHIIVQNKTDKAVNELILVIKNTDAERTVTLSGSDDQKQWYVIREHILLSNEFTIEHDRFIQSLNFPNSSYKFFELIINGKDVLPVNIVKVGVYEGSIHNGEFASIPEPTIVQNDSSNKQSYISLLFNEDYLVNKLQLTTKGPKFFRRHLSIQKDNSYSSGDYILSSDSDPVYNINIKSKKILLIIENQDNPPLKLQSVNAYQLNKYLLTYLEPATKYEVVFGDSTVYAPNYDLEFFKDSLSKSITEISTGSITKNDPVKNSNKQEGSKSMLTLWIIITCVLVLLIILTFRMTKEVAKKEKQE